jgi:hypothetical protein
MVVLWSESKVVANQIKAFFKNIIYIYGGNATGRNGFMVPVVQMGQCTMTDMGPIVDRTTTTGTDPVRRGGNKVS